MVTLLRTTQIIWTKYHHDSGKTSKGIHLGQLFCLFVKLNINSNLQYLGFVFKNGFIAELL